MGKSLENRDKVKKRVIELLKRAGEKGLSKGEIADLLIEPGLSEEKITTFKRTLASWLSNWVAENEIQVSPYEGYTRCLYYLK